MTTDTLPQQQAVAILQSLSEYCTATPGRAVLFTATEDGFAVELHEPKRTRGPTLADALAQAATVAILDDEPGAPVEPRGPGRYSHRAAGVPIGKVEKKDKG